MIMLQDHETGSSSRTLSAPDAGSGYGSRFWSAAEAGPGSAAGVGSIQRTPLWEQVLERCRGRSIAGSIEQVLEQRQVQALGAGSYRCRGRSKHWNRFWVVAEAGSGSRRRFWSAAGAGPCSRNKF